jgi:two-component system, sporulation sensor kinase D
MDIYTRKSNYKLFLLFVALAIALGTTLYTNHLTQKIANEEKKRAKLWADAVSSRAKLVRYTNDLFKRLAEDERDKVNIWAQSTKFVLQVDNNEELNFFSDVITGNTDIPVVLADESGLVIDYRNFQSSAIRGKVMITNSEFDNFRTYPPILIKYGSTSNYIYYNDSNLFIELKETLNEIISSFISEVVINTASAPVLLTDNKLNLLAFGNIDSVDVASTDNLLRTIKRMEENHSPILVDLGEGVQQKIYYDDSEVLRQLKIFPFIILLIFGAFALFSYLAMSNARRAEQNQVWVGLAKETAHQLGTPISSLSAWVEYMKENNQEPLSSNIINEIENDVERLTLVADRFSKIGAQPQLSPAAVLDTVNHNVNYIKQRASKSVDFFVNCTDNTMLFSINKQLFNWVLENLFNNALDAMNGAGKLIIDVSASSSNIFIDVTDTGCGIPKGKYNTIFEPGFSTKRRGWGLGLSLTKRIVEEYHHGKIFVKSSEPNQGTTFRIELPRYTESNID